MNIEKAATSATHWVKLLIYNTIVCSRYELSTCYTFFVPATHCYAGARGTSRGPWSVIHDSFCTQFHAFLLIKASWNNSDKPLRNESVNMGRYS